MMRDLYLTLFIIVCVVALVAMAWQTKSKRIPDARLKYYLDYLRRPRVGRNSKGFKRTTAPLSEEDYKEIKTLFTRQLLAEWEERQTQIANEFSIRAIELEQAFRYQAENPGKPLPAEIQAVFFREGVRPDEISTNQGKTKNETNPTTA